MSCAENVLFFFAAVSVKLTTYFPNNLFVLSLLLRFVSTCLKISFHFISSIENKELSNFETTFLVLTRLLVSLQYRRTYYIALTADNIPLRHWERNFNFCELAHWKRKFHFQCRRNKNCWSKARRIKLTLLNIWII